MPLTPQEKELVSEMRRTEIQWRVQRWFALVLFAVMTGAGFLLPYQDVRFVGPLGVILLLATLKKWPGDASRRLVLALAKRIEDQKNA